MSVIGASQAASSLQVSQRRVRQLLESGQLSGQRVGGRWVINCSDVERLRRAGAGRPWSARSAWAVLELAAGGNPELSPVERSRARKRLADHELAGLVGKLRSRSERREMYAHLSALDRIGDEAGGVRGGVSALNAHGVDLIVSNEAEIYIRSSEAAGFADRYALQPGADRPNLIVRVVDDDVWPFAEDVNIAPWPVVAVDLLDADDERSRRAGLDLIGRHH